MGVLYKIRLGISNHAIVFKGKPKKTGLRAYGSEGLSGLREMQSPVVLVVVVVVVVVWRWVCQWPMEPAPAREKRGHEKRGQAFCGSVGSGRS